MVTNNNKKTKLDKEDIQKGKMDAEGAQAVEAHHFNDENEQEEQPVESTEAIQKAKMDAEGAQAVEAHHYNDENEKD